MNPKKLITGAVAGCMLTAAGSVFAASFQEEAFNFGALRFTMGDAELTSDYACGAAACVLPTAQTTSTDDISAVSILPAVAPGFSFDASFFEPTNYLGAFDPNATTQWWEGWTLSDGPGSLQPGFFHPLSDNLLNGTLLPDLTVTTTADCEAKFYDDGTPQIAGGVTIAATTATAEGVAFPVCVVNTAVMPVLREDATMTSDVIWLIAGGNNLQVGDGDVANINTNAAGCDGSNPAINPSTITIEAGAQIFGDNSAGTGSLNGIEVTRGSTILANGTADLPIVISSADAGNISWPSATNDFTGISEFAGVIVNGCGFVNSATSFGGDVASEAVQAGETRLYGGSVPTDSSGVITYVVIAESGAEFQPDEEVQGLTLEGVAAGTTINNIHIHYSGDDGIEWFGGNVNAKYLVVSVMNDDGLDMDLGFQGLIQYAMVLQSTTLGERTIEADNFSDANPDRLPRTMPTISNLTLLGAAGDPASTSIGMMMRQGMGGFYDKVVIADQGDTPALRFDGGCIDMDNQTPNGAAGPANAIATQSLIFTNTLFDCDAGPLVADTDPGAVTFFTSPVLASAVAPLSRFVDVSGGVASYFVSMINPNAIAGLDCLVQPINAVDATYLYQSVDAANMLNGPLNGSKDIGAGATEGYVIAYNPRSAFAAAPQEMSAHCINLGATASLENLNQPVLGANAGPTADIIALLTATTMSIPLNGANVLAAGSFNAGNAAGTMTVGTTLTSTDVQDSTVCTVCEFMPGTTNCVVPTAPTATVNYIAGSSTSIGVFCFNNGDPVANDPANNRVTVDFTEAGTLKGQASFDMIAN